MDELSEAYTVRQMHPESLQGSAQSLFEFLSGWFGGPALYIANKGHPRLRMRHAPYAVGPVVRDEWMLCMQQALTEQVTDELLRTRLVETFSQMASHLLNTSEHHGCAVIALAPSQEAGTPSTRGDAPVSGRGAHFLPGAGLVRTAPCAARHRRSL